MILSLTDSLVQSLSHALADAGLPPDTLLHEAEQAPSGYWRVKLDPEAVERISSVVESSSRSSGATYFGTLTKEELKERWNDAVALAA
jgi:hypothetical protein